MLLGFLVWVVFKGVCTGHYTDNYGNDHNVEFFSALQSEGYIWKRRETVAGHILAVKAVLIILFHWSKVAFVSTNFRKYISLAM